MAAQQQQRSTITARWLEGHYLQIIQDNEPVLTLAPHAVADMALWFEQATVDIDTIRASLDYSVEAQYGMMEYSTYFSIYGWGFNPYPFM